MKARGTKPSIVLFLALGVFALIQSAQAGPRNTQKMEKQIAIFERVIDHMLVESPNFLIRGGRDNAQGTYMDDHGAVFIFRTSLNSHNWNNSGWSWRRLLHDDDDDWGEREKADEKKLYTDGKEEIVDVIRDFGEVLTTLGDEDWLEIRVRLRGAEYFKENRLRKLTVKVLMGDVRAYMDGDLSESRFRDQVEINES